jgi:hypothetical protein
VDKEQDYCLPILHTFAYDRLMPLVQVRNVPERTVARLKAKADERGMTLAAFVRAELEHIASRPTNDEVLARLSKLDRSTGPTHDETVTQLRRIRESS